MIIIPDDIIYIILDKADIKCHTCLRRHFIPHKKIANNYFCSKICYEFI